MSPLSGVAGQREDNPAKGRHPMDDHDLLARQFEENRGHLRGLAAAYFAELEVRFVEPFSQACSSRRRRFRRSRRQ
jgi:hypothetical protein